jgi:hypothetical protein
MFDAGTELQEIVDGGHDLEDEGASRLDDFPTLNRELAANLLGETPAEIKAEAADALRDPKLLTRVVENVERLGVAGERDVVAAVYLIGLSRLLPKPLAGIVQGPSSSGKSFTVDTTAKLVPPEGVIHAKDISAKALYYGEPGWLVHRFVVAGERPRAQNDEVAEKTRALREMLSSGQLSKVVSVKGENRWESRKVFQPGPIAYVETTTLGTIFDEDRNRCILLATDDTPEQTERIIRATARRSADPGVQKEGLRVIAVHHAMQRILAEHQPPAVLIPFAERLAEHFPQHRPEARRGFDQVLSMVQAVALLHSQQRTMANGAIIATAHDYRVARYLLDKPMRRLLGSGVSDSASKLFERLLDWVKGEFTTTEVVEREYKTATDKTVRDWMNELHAAGWIKQIRPARGPHPGIWALVVTRREDRDFGSLPALE